MKTLIIALILICQQKPTFKNEPYYNGWGRMPGHSHYKDGWNSEDHFGGRFWYRGNYYPPPRYNPRLTRQYRNYRHYYDPRYINPYALELWGF